MNTLKKEKQWFKYVYSVKITFKDYDNNRITKYQACCLMLSVCIHCLISSVHLWNI